MPPSSRGARRNFSGTRHPSIVSSVVEGFMDPGKPEVAQILQTCAACPSQWEGRLTDGRPFYIRYRWGHLSVSFGEAGASLDSAVDGMEWFGEQIGDSFDGVISIEDVCRRTGLIKPE